jgi:hypothetical protein
VRMIKSPAGRAPATGYCRNPFTGNDPAAGLPPLNEEETE